MSIISTNLKILNCQTFAILQTVKLSTRNMGANCQKAFLGNRLAWLIIIASTAVFIGYELLGYSHFLWTVLDLGLFNRHLWALAHFQLSQNPLKGADGLPGINLLADHAHFILLALVPFYWLRSSPVILLLVQALALGLSGIPIYLIAKEYIDSPNIAAAWLVPYFLYFGFWAMLGYPFHEIALAVLILPWALYFLIQERNLPLVISLMLLMLVKEDMPLVVIMFGLYLLIIKRSWRLGSFLLVIGTAYFMFLMNYWFPVMNHGIYPYAQNALGHGFKDTIIAMVVHPVTFIKALFLPIDKSKTMILMLLTFGGILPLLGTEFFALVAPLWLDRFLSVQAWRWLPIEHYSADQGPILVVAAIIGAHRLSALLKPKIKPSLAMIGCIVLSTLGAAAAHTKAKPHYIAHLLRPSFYTFSSSDQVAQQAINMVPSTASVGVQSAFPQLTSRANVYNLPMDLSITAPRYLLLATPYDRWPFNTQQDVLDFVNSAETKYGYRALISHDGVYLLKK